MKLSERIQRQKERVLTLATGPEGDMIRTLNIIAQYQRAYLKSSSEINKLLDEKKELVKENKRLILQIKELRLLLNDEEARRREADSNRFKTDRLLELMKQLLEEKNSELSDEDRETIARFAACNSQRPRYRRSSRYKSRSILSDSELSFDACTSDESSIQYRPKRPSAPPLEVPDAKVCRTDDDEIPDVAYHITHEFSSKNTILGDECKVCRKKIRFGKMLQCKACKISCHVECRNLASSCQLSSTACGYENRKEKIGPLTKYISTTGPQVPNIMAVLIKEVETRGRNECGIYRVPGSVAVVNQIVDDINRGQIPYLSGHDVHTSCSVLKDWLKRLDEPLVTFALRNKFLDCANFNNADGSTCLRNIIYELPDSNRETLAFLIMHLQRVTTWRECNMPVSNIAKVFGPTLIGQGRGHVNNDVLLREVKYQHIIVERMLLIPSDYWSNFLQKSHSDDDYRTPRSNGVISTDDGLSTDSETPRRIFGPASAIAHRTRQRLYLGTPRKEKSQYFSSPRHR